MPLWPVSLSHSHRLPSSTDYILRKANRRSDRRRLRWQIYICNLTQNHTLPIKIFNHSAGRPTSRMFCRAPSLTIRTIMACRKSQRPMLEIETLHPAVVACGEGPADVFIWSNRRNIPGRALVRAWSDRRPPLGKKYSRWLKKRKAHKKESTTTSPRR